MGRGVEYGREDRTEVRRNRDPLPDRGLHQASQGGAESDGEFAELISDWLVGIIGRQWQHRQRGDHHRQRDQAQDQPYQWLARTG